MPRYLTPTKLALLLLIDIHTNTDLAPTARHEILNFLAARIIIRSELDGSGLDERYDLSSANEISAFAHPLSQLPTNVPGRSVYDIFLNKVWTLDGLDGVVEFVKNVVDSVGTIAKADSDEQEATLPKISRASPLGQFIRRSYVELTRLQFSDAQSLWSSFAALRLSSHSMWASRNPDAAKKLHASQPTWASQPAESSLVQISTDDTALLLRFSINHLQKLGHRLPPGLKANLATFVDQNLDASSQSLQHFLSFFEHWRAGQYTMALESLHRYFDYSIASHGPGAMGREGGKDGNGVGGGPGGARVYYHYALLHLSVLHADFERWEASVAAMEECVATARESQDTPCLLLALSWLLYLRQAHSNSQAYNKDGSDVSTSFGNLAISSSTQADEITFLKTKAREMKFWSLLSSTLLDEGRGELASGNATIKALEHLLQAQYLNTTHDLRSQMPASMLFQAAALERLGHNTLAHNIYVSIPLLHAKHIPLPERVRAGCRLARSLDHRGDFSQAIRTLDELEQSLGNLSTLKSKQRVMGWRMVICMKRELRRDDIGTATRYLDELQPFLSLSSDPDLSFEIIVLGIELQLHSDRRAEALARINEHIRLLKQNPSADIAQTLTLLLLKCRTFTTGPNSANTSPKAFSLALRAAATAQRCHLLPLLCEAVEILAHIMNDLGEYDAARDLVEGVMPLAIESHNTSPLARLYTTLTDSHLGCSNSGTTSTSSPATKQPLSSSPSSKPSLSLSHASTYLDLAYTLYTRLEDLQGQLDCLVKKHLLAKFKGDDVGAEKAEEMFVQVLEDSKRRMREER